ncbi:hypothetical protein ElyMa_005878000 [Elysia marginata]|uniref:Uncharacterized protein n=1 Tax=Elysia marginata TaxID=1093978 RepID=A0AAV4G1R8_9GAST|nr:hypothetical protein ElyMa_005878000 [Elysia marginata]
MGKILIVFCILCAALPLVFSQNQNTNVFDPFGLLSLFGPVTGTTDPNANALNNLFGLYFLDEYADIDAFDLFKRKRRRR